MSPQKKRGAVPKLGAHISIAGGAFNAPHRGLGIGCETIQIFTRNQTQWRCPPLIHDDVVRFHKAVEETRVGPIVAHDSYLINLGSPDTSMWAQSRAAFDLEIDRAERLGVHYLVFHPGAHMRAGEDYGLQRIADAINLALEKAAGHKLRLLLESTAGQGSALGYRFEHLAAIIDKTEDKSRIGVCLDTCHVFAAGYELRTAAGYKETVREFDRVVGLQWLKAWHLNDSKKELGSRRDRHEQIGRGCIGAQGFRNILHDPRMAGLPMILETGGQEKELVEDMATLRSLLAGT